MEDLYERYSKAYLGTPESKRYFQIMDAANVGDSSVVDPPLTDEEKEVYEKIRSDLLKDREKLNRPDLIYVRPNDIDA